MFTNKKTIIFITKSKIKISTVVVGNKPKENIVAEVNYSPANLQEALSKFKKNIGDTVRVLLNEDIAYTVTVFSSGGAHLDRDTIRQKAQELIPEDLNNTIWDFKKVAPAPLSGAPEMIQVVAVNRVLSEELTQAITKAGLHIEAIEPLLIALARFIKNKEAPLIIAYIGDEIFLGLTQKGVVLATERLTVLDVNAINQFIAFTKERLAIEPKEIVFCGNTKDIDINQYQQSLSNVTFQLQDINPLISLAYKEDIKGKDEQVLNLEILKTITPVGEQNKLDNLSPKSSAAVKKQHLSKTTIFAVLLVIAVIILVTLILYKVYFLNN